MRRTNTLIVIAFALLAMATASCDKGRLGRNTGLNAGKGVGIRLNTASFSDMTESKAGATAVLNNVYGNEDDGFVIEEYVSDISSVLESQGTKGTIITTTGINSTGKSFTVDGWGMISPEKGKPQVLTNHLPKLTANYSSGTPHWPWAGGADPKWVNEANLHIWSYYPVGKINPTITIDDSASPVNNKAAFTSYTTDNTDLLIAYNKEFRKFQTDAAGNHTYNAAGEIVDPIIGDDYFNVKFYHALAAIEFELVTDFDSDDIQDKTSTGDVDFHGADVHSITLCKVNSDNTISTTTGIATTGDCVATGSGTGTGSVSFSWSNLTNTKPLHYEFGAGQSVAGGYTSATGAGVLFMIPQTVQNIKIIVEFSKNGSTKYNAKVVNLPAVEWKAGYYYKYKLKVGEFHVPGEKMAELTNILIQGLDASKTLLIRPEGDPVPSKGVTKMALITKGYGLEIKGNQVVSMHSNAYGGDNYVPSQVDSIAFDLLPYTLDASDNLTSFGGDGITEKYGKRADFTNTTYNNNKNPTIVSSTAAAYVFETGGKDTFFLYFRPQNNSNNGGFAVELRGLYVVEVAKDPNLPGNFPLDPWP